MPSQEQLLEMSLSSELYLEMSGLLLASFILLGSFYIFICLGFVLVLFCCFLCCLLMCLGAQFVI